MSIYSMGGLTLLSANSVDGVSLNKAYDVIGNEVFSASSKTYPVSSNYTASLMFDLGAIMSGTQGLAADSISNELAQLYTGKILMIDADTGAYNQVASALNMLHGGGGQFKPTKESSEDDYPLLYVSGGKSITDTENEIYYAPLLETKIQNGSSTFQRVFLADEGVSYGGGGHYALDFDNGIAYHVYSPTFYDTSDYTYISAWDMTSYESIEAPTTNPNPRNGYWKFTNKLDSFTIPFVQENQSVSFIDGTIALISDVGNNSVHFVDPEERRTYLVITEDMPSGEIEGIAFLYNSTTNKKDMVLCSRNNSTTDPHNWYYRYQFT